MPAVKPFWEAKCIKDTDKKKIPMLSFKTNYTFSENFITFLPVTLIVRGWRLWILRSVTNKSYKTHYDKHACETKGKEHDNF